MNSRDGNSIVLTPTQGKRVIRRRGVATDNDMDGDMDDAGTPPPVVPAPLVDYMTIII
jgi:hypothetical protein